MKETLTGNKMNKEYNAWFSTSHGKYINLSQVKPSDVSIDDIDISLNNIRRFTGHAKINEPLTVAQHTIVCYQLAYEMIKKEGNELSNLGKKRLLLGTLMHDFPEAYYGDISSGLKRVLGNDLKRVTNPIDKAVEKALWPWSNKPLTDTEKDFIHITDMLSLHAERKYLFGSYPQEDSYWPSVNRDSPWYWQANRSLKTVVRTYWDHVPLAECYENCLERKE